MKTNPEKATIRQSIGGFYKARVMNSDGSPATDWIEQHNLILPGGFQPAHPFKNHMVNCHVGTGNTPNSAPLDGTYSQTGTTVTRVSGTGTFVAGNVNDFVKFATGETAKILSVTNTVTVEVSKSQTVAAAALTIYDTSRTLLDAWTKVTNTLESGASGVTQDTDAGTTRYWKTFNFTAETVAVNYTEVGVNQTGLLSSSALFSRVVFDAPIAVGVEQFLQVRFDLVCAMTNYRTSEPITIEIDGWPYQYTIQSITSNGTYWDVVVNEACSTHYATGRPITIAGALPATTAITTITSTASDFTVNATAHGKTSGQSVVIAGATPAGYNGTWTVLSATTNAFVVTSAANLGAGSGGTVRLATPGTWYDGTHTIASFPNSTTIRITNATSIAAAGVAGTVKNSIAATAICTGYAFTNTDATATTWSYAPFDPTTGAWNSGSGNVQMQSEANMYTGQQYGVTPAVKTALASINLSTKTYNATTLETSYSAIFLSGIANDQTIRQIQWGGSSTSSGRLTITFDERQRKNNGYQLTIGYKVAWEPSLN